MRTAASARPVPIVQYRTSDECANASAVVARQARGLVQPAGLGFVALESDLEGWQIGTEQLGEPLIRLDTLPRARPGPFPSPWPGQRRAGGVV
jgi:hypothetical protein